MDNIKTRKKKYIAVICVLLVITFSSLATTIFLYMRTKNYETSMLTSYTLDEAAVLVQDSADNASNNILTDIKSKYEDGTSTISLLRSLYPDNLVFYDTDRYVFASILNSVPKHDLAASNFSITADKELTYSENGAVVSHKGIDVSKFQGTIDWNKVKNDGVEYAIIRVGNRSYGTGIINDDPTFEDNIKGATAAGIDVGVYFFSQAITTAEAVEEANYVLDKIKDYDVTCPVVFDVEEIANDSYRQQDLTSKELTDISIAFCEKVKSAGYTPMIYSNLKGFVGNLELARLNAYEKWYAAYDSSSLYFPYELSMWQYSDSGSVDGITGKVDMNISFKDWN